MEDYVKIEYAKTTAPIINIIEYNTYNDGTYEWTIPVV